MQRSTLSAIAAAVLFAVGVQSAEASSTSVVSAPVTDVGAIQDDPNLAGKVFNSIQVTIPQGADWTNTRLIVTRTSPTGTIYNATNMFQGFLPVGVENSPNEPLWTQVGARNGNYDSFVNSSPNPFDRPDNGAQARGQKRDAVFLEQVGRPFADPNPTSITAEWGNLIPDFGQPNPVVEDGTFQVAQVTLSPDFAGTATGITYSNVNTAGTPFSFPIIAGAIVPEPSALGVLAAAGLLVLRRRRRA